MTFHVAFAADDAVFRYSGNMMRSLLAHSSEPVQFHAFVNFPPEPAKIALAKALPEADVVFYQLKSDDLAGLSVKANLSAMAFARILMPDLMPVDRFLYLDTDMVVLADVAELLTVDLEGNVIAAVMFGDALNSGLIVFDCALWRAENLTQTALAYARDHHPKEADQTTLQEVLKGRIKRLNQNWNMMLDPVWTPATRLDVSKTSQAKVIHFVTGFKPWNMGRYLLPSHLMEVWRRFDAPFALPINWAYEWKILRWQIFVLLRRIFRKM